jgi:hypothetical protein
VVLALDLARGGINQVFAHLGKDVEESFGEVEEAFRAAAFDGDA